SAIKRGIEIFQYIVEHGKTINEIRQIKQFAKYSDTECARLLSTAFLSQSLQLVGVERDTNLEERLQTEFSLRPRRTIISGADLPSGPVIDEVIRAETIAFLAANEDDFLSSIAHVGEVGMTGGIPLSRFVDLVEPNSEQFAGNTWYSLLCNLQRQNICNGI